MASAEAKILLSNGLITVIDAKDVPLVKRWRWHGRNCGAGTYAARTTSIYPKGQRRKVVNIYLHRFLTSCPAGLQVDHRNGDTLDNRRRNLEIVTPATNCQRRGDAHPGLEE